VYIDREGRRGYKGSEGEREIRRAILISARNPFLTCTSIEGREKGRKGAMERERDQTCNMDIGLQSFSCTHTSMEAEREVKKRGKREKARERKRCQQARERKREIRRTQS